MWIEIVKWLICKFGVLDKVMVLMDEDEKCIVICSVLSFLNEINGVLRVEDIFFFFFDFIIIDDVKDLVL